MGAVIAPATATTLTIESRADAATAMATAFTVAPETSTLRRAVAAPTVAAIVAAATATAATAAQQQLQYYLQWLL